ncbi:ABC transporter permease subunit [Streptomyces sp. BE20]|uniref:ABC transporter n=1 Tax=Streptomyces sp. BE20 TaxID=3002525 RepID=UPI002E772DB8|nr:ABC transporter [Streptomyces sp. BE20]MEE1821288.1 ABC transporter permease subunit [Streptomyces sp. BE20]
MSTMAGTSPSPRPTGAATGARRRPALHGLSWLVWRQHRATLRTVLALTVVGVAFIAYRRAGMMDHLARFDWPHPTGDEWRNGFGPFSGQLNDTGFQLGLVPVVLGVFLGAPLFASDLETGTAKLVTGQSVSRMRWLTAKLGLALAVSAVATVALSAAFTWWYHPVKATSSDWTSGAVFDATGPVPVALTLFTVTVGALIGMLLRRSLAAMVVTLGAAVAIKVAWSAVRLPLGTATTVVTRDGVGTDAFPELPTAAYTLDQSFVTSSGKLLGWGTCSSPTEAARDACVSQKGIVGWSVDYLPVSQMPVMQWLGAGILLALAAAVTTFVVLWGRKRLL